MPKPLEKLRRVVSQRDANDRPEIAPLDWREWDFRSNRLRDEELVACHAHEYGREVASRCSYILTQLKIVWRAQELPEKDKPRLSDARIEPPYRKIHPDWLRRSNALDKLRSFNIPWTLSSKEFHNKSWSLLPPDIRRDATQSFLHKKKNSLNRISRDSMCLSIHTPREFSSSGLNTMQLFQWRDEIRRVSNSKVGGRVYDRENVEHGFFSINWNCPVGVLKKQFAEWVDFQLKVLKKGPSLGQSKPSRGQLRDQLNWLGALRIKEHYDRKNLVESNCPDVKVAAPYSKLPDLYLAAKKGSKIIEERVKKIMEN